MASQPPIPAEMVSKSADGRRAQLIVRRGAYAGTYHARYFTTGTTPDGTGNTLIFHGAPNEKTGEQLKFAVTI